MANARIYTDRSRLIHMSVAYCKRLIFSRARDKSKYHKSRKRNVKIYHWLEYHFVQIAEYIAIISDTKHK